jgi:CBS domain-containing protein
MAGSATSVREAMTPNPSSVGPDASVLEAAQVMRAEGIGSVPVVQDDRLIGMLTDRDIVLRVVAEEKDPASMTSAGIASRELVTVRADESLDEALRLMAKHQVRRLPVVEDGHRLVGIVAQADVAEAAGERETGELVERISETTKDPRS